MNAIGKFGIHLGCLGQQGGEHSRIEYFLLQGIDHLLLSFGAIEITALGLAIAGEGQDLPAAHVAQAARGKHGLVRTKVIRNEQYALAALGGVFGIGALIGVVISIPILLLPLILIRKKKN